MAKLRIDKVLPGNKVWHDHGADDLSGVVKSVVAGTNVSVDDTDPANPIVSSTASGGGDVTGPSSSTDNAIVRFDSTTGKLIQNSSATIDDSGNTNLSGVLKVDSNDSWFGNIYSGSYVDVGTSGTTDVYIDARGISADVGIVLRTKGSDDFFFSNTVNGDLIRIKSDGKLGIGTTSPAEKLDVVGNALITGKITVDNNDSYFGNTSTGSYVDIGTSGTTDVYFDARGVSSDVGMVFRTKGSDDFFFANTINGDLVRIKPDGKVGIGITSPTEKLDVAGNIAVSGTVDARDIATDGAKLDGIEAGADVTDTANVTSAGALMDSEVDADIKTLTIAANASISGGNTGDQDLSTVSRAVQIVVIEYATDVATGDGKAYFHVDSRLNGKDLVDVHAEVITAGTTGTTDVQIYNVTDSVDMLSTKITIDSGETGSDTAATPAVIDTTKDDIATNDLIRIDIDAISTTAPKGLIVTLGFE